MKNSDRLKEIEGSQCTREREMPDYYEEINWLINRVRVLTEALNGIIKSDEKTWKKYPQSKGIYSYYADMARKALEEENGT